MKASFPRWLTRVDKSYLGSQLMFAVVILRLERACHVAIIDQVGIKISRV